jgi:hypothetical protein
MSEAPGGGLGGSQLPLTGQNIYKSNLVAGLRSLTDYERGGETATAQAPPAAFGRGGGQGGLQGGPPRQGTTVGGGAAQRGNESQEYVKKEEKELIQAVKERTGVREEQEERRKKRETRKPFNVPQGQNVMQLSLSPDEKYVLATVSQSAVGSKNAIVPNYVTESGYTEDISARAKVGDARDTHSALAVIELGTGEVKWVDHGQRLQDARSEARTDSRPVVESGERSRAPDPRERDVRMFNPLWSDDGHQAVVLARAADNKDRWILVIDPSTGKTRSLDHLHDDAWIDGPGAQTLGWLPDSKRVYFQSERDGYAHLYTANADGGDVKQVTQGQFEVSDVRLSADKTKFYFTSSEGSPFERHLYTMPVDGGPRTRVTSMAGNNDCEISPDERMLAIIRSYSKTTGALSCGESTRRRSEAGDDVSEC